MNTNNNTNNTNNANNANVNNTNNRIEVAAQKTPILQLYKEMKTMGVNLGFITFDDTKVGVRGWGAGDDNGTSERVLRMLAEGCDNPYDMMSRMQLLTALFDSGIEPDEEVEVEGVSCYISYKDKTLYRACDCKAVCDLNDLNCDLPKEAIKTLLIERATR